MKKKRRVVNHCFFVVAVVMYVCMKKMANISAFFFRLVNSMSCNTSKIAIGFCSVDCDRAKMHTWFEPTTIFLMHESLQIVKYNIVFIVCMRRFAPTNWLVGYACGNDFTNAIRYEHRAVDPISALITCCCVAFDVIRRERCKRCFDASL